MDTLQNPNLRRGNCYFGFTDITDVAVLTARQRVTLNNPANSGKNIVITSIVVDTTAQNFSFGTVYKNPTANLSNSALISNPHFGFDGTTSVAQFKYDTTNAAIGGSKIGVLGVGNGRTVYGEIDIVLPPGTGVGMDLQFLNLASLIKSSLIMFWYEEDK